MSNLGQIKTTSYWLLITTLVVALLLVTFAPFLAIGKEEHQKKEHSIDHAVPFLSSNNGATTKESRKVSSEKASESEELNVSQNEFSSSEGTNKVTASTVSVNDKSTTTDSFSREMSAIREHVRIHELPSSIKERLNEYEEAHLESLYSGTKSSRNVDHEKLRESLKTRENDTMYRAQNTPFRAIEFDGSVNDRNVSEFQRDFSGGDAQYRRGGGISTQNTSENNEIVFTEAIRNKASELEHDPLAILNYVRNAVFYAPYHGLKKGANSTLLQGEGNAYDQAALLSALLRVGNDQGDYKIPTRYKEVVIKLDPSTVVELLGVSDVDVATEVLDITGVPYARYVNGHTGEILFFVIDHVYVEAYIDYGYRRGLVQSQQSTTKQWIPLDPVMRETFTNQTYDVIDEMKASNDFDYEVFFDSYLEGDYGLLTPVQALEQDITSYLSANSDYQLDDIEVDVYRKNTTLDYIPRTLPYEVLENLGQYDEMPSHLMHVIEILVENESNNTTVLSDSLFTAQIADQEFTLTYEPADPADQATIDSFGTIYDVVPLSLVRLKPVLQVAGETVVGGGAQDPSDTAGLEHKTTMTFTVPERDVVDNIANRKTAEVIEKPIRVGNTFGIGINLGVVPLSETRPASDTSSQGFLGGQKLYRTAFNYLYRDGETQERLAKIMGGELQHDATRAYVFNGVDTVYSAGLPHSFTWKGLKIDATSLISFYNRVADEVDHNQVEFLSIFGLESSLDEANVFESDYGIESMSTVKGLRLIHTGAVPGRVVHKIDSTNQSLIQSLNLSNSTKSLYQDLVDDGMIIYTPDSDFTYRDWTGLAYIYFNPATGGGGYIFGEGFNGGATVEQWPSGWQNTFANWALDSVGNAVILSPHNGDVFTIGDNILWIAQYGGISSWEEVIVIDTEDLGVGDWTLYSGYGTTDSVAITIEQGGPSDPPETQQLGQSNNQFDAIIIREANNFGIPPQILKSIIHKETNLPGFQFNPNMYRYEPHIDYSDFSGPNPRIGLTAHPYRQFAIGGYTTDGAAVAEGSQVNDLNPPYEQMILSKGSGGWSLRSIILDDANGDNTVTVAELKANDESRSGSQGWLYGANTDHTAQLLLNASYGLGQVLYRSAFEIAEDEQGNLWFDTSTSGQARDIYDMVDPDTSVRLAASVLKYKYDHVTASPQDNQDCDGWGHAVRGYNGSGSRAESYRNNVCEQIINLYQ